ncbi:MULTISPECIES: isochorismate synthase [unclassified Pseudonocardia]|uniref:isochorismate synthase n=1 Tax=unclassified Pseudonocardia TaxID=2619320 RepID=UPI00094B6F8D|nr:isochorismate synthase [Pseudonocardia sp. Ae707_Ps1]OLM21010.1 Isochorismate synthase of siderophore biosynthesis [Pseudonocardia sp. Ae707_Ps1]
MSSPAPARPLPEHDSGDLLAAYLPGSFFHRSPRGTLLADGVHTVVPESPGSPGDAVAGTLAAVADAGHPDPVVVGAIGFAPGAPRSLHVPALVRRAAPSPAASGPVRVPEPPGSRWSMRHEPAPETYADGVRRALGLIGEGRLEKVVLARALELTSQTPVPVRDLLTRLALADPAAFAFAADVTAPGDPALRTLVGASPELLVSREGGTVVTNPLAGSIPRSDDPAENEARIAALKVSGKDLAEHALVADRVVAVLRGFCTEVDAPTEPEVIGTATMWHLSSRISGRLADPSVSALHLAHALHPTPAVCGVPVPAAREAIGELEPSDRGYYSGMTGWVDADGDGEWVLAIRSAEVCDRTVRLYAGAGIVAGSDPDSEVAETRAKFRTMLRAIGVEAVA